MRFSFARITLAAMFAVLLLIAIETAFLVHFSQEQERLASQPVPSYAGKLLARQIEAIASEWSRATQAIAQSPLSL